MNTTRRKGGALALVAALALWGCSDLSVEGGGPLDLVITPSATSAAVGTEVRFDYEVRGTFLNGVIFDYGDGSPLDSVPTSGAQSARGQRRHTFDAAGQFQVTGRVEDASQGSLSRTVAIEITPPTPTPSR